MRSPRTLRRAALGALLLCLFGLPTLLAPTLRELPRSADARPGGGQNYRAPSRPSSPSRSSSPSYRGSSPSYRSTPYRSSPSYGTPVPVPVPIPRSSSPGYGDSGQVGEPSAGSVIGGLIVMAVIVGVFVLVIWLVIRKLRGLGRARPGVREDVGVAERGLQALRAQDRAFDPAAFAERVKATVGKVNEAWQKGHMGPARRLISDGVYVRFQTQLGLLKQQGLKNLMADWSVLSAAILGAEADALWDTVHVKVVAQARDVEVPLSWEEGRGEAQAKRAPLSPYEEVWSFLRRRGRPSMPSKAGVPALEGRCPNCGADLPLSDVVRCGYCQAIVNSGEHDWVLAEITQPEEWSPRGSEREVPGLAELRQRDPSVSRQELEDRASVIFWKWIEARSSGKLDKLRRFCLAPPQDAAAAAQLGLQPARLEKVAVGSAEVQAISDSGELVQAPVEIRWSAGVDGREPEGMVHVFLLARAATATSKRGLSSLDCPSCGGQLAESDAVTCTYCGEPLGGGKHEWALGAVMAGEAPPPDDDDSDEE